MHFANRFKPRTLTALLTLAIIFTIGTTFVTAEDTDRWSTADLVSGQPSRHAFWREWAAAQSR